MTEQQFEQLRGRPVRAGDDAEIGTLAEVFLGSTDGSLFYGFNADRETLPDLDRLAAVIGRSPQRLV